jgi:hypothetical protein
LYQSGERPTAGHGFLLKISGNAAKKSVNGSALFARSALTNL